MLKIESHHQVVDCYRYYRYCITTTELSCEGVDLFPVDMPRPQIASLVREMRNAVRKNIFGVLEAKQCLH